MSNRIIHALLLTLAVVTLARPSAAQERSLALSVGTFGVLDTEELFEAGLEYRMRPVAYGLRPIVGASVLQDGGNYIFGGARYEYNLTERWQIAPSFAAGIYSAGSIDLGGPLEFRSGLDVSRRISPDLSVALGFYHLSNGGLYSLNGGSESLVFSLAYDL
jgi:lipid A 3-O-deacylase